jgi:CRISPR-associated protein Csy1
MHDPSPHRQSEIRNLIQGFIAERLATKLEGLANDDPKRATLLEQYQPAACWQMPPTAPGRSRR